MTVATLLMHAVATLYMVGLIWFVQLVHYPLAGQVGAEAFVAYQKAHMDRTAFAVGPAMLTELATVIVLLWRCPPEIPAWAPWVGAALLLGIWASTALLQVPLHHALLQGRDSEALSQLVRTNWIRTVGWTVRGVLAVALLAWASGDPSASPAG